MSVSKVKLVEVDEGHVGQRIDNFLMGYFTKVPKSRIYRALRNGEVRVNKGRVKPVYRVQLGDVVRLPPINVISKDDKPVPVPSDLIELLENKIIFPVLPASMARDTGPSRNAIVCARPATRNAAVRP